MRNPGLLASLGFITEGSDTEATSTSSRVVQRKPDEDARDAQDALTGTGLLDRAKQAASGALGAAALARDLLADVGVWPSSQASSSRKPTLAQQLGLSITTAPQVGGNQRALVGMQVTFAMRLARPPRDVAVTITEWELVTPRGRWATTPRGPSTTLPITAAGPHLFRAKIRLSDGRELAIEHGFEAIMPAEHAGALLGATDDVPYEQFRSQQELQRALLRPPGADEQGKGAMRRIVTSAANPTPVDGSDRPRQIMFPSRITSDQPALVAALDIIGICGQ